MADFLKEYPGCRTAILAYLKLDSSPAEVEGILTCLRTQAALQAGLGRPFWPQIALETRHLNLAGFVRELQRPGSRVERNVRLLAREIARYREQPKWFFLRPFSEMNDATADAPWELGHPTRANTPRDLALAWIRLRQAFDREGATNALFVFSPLAAWGVHRQSQVLEALNRIPVGLIDAFGLNLYSRPRRAYGGRSAQPISFAELAQPWITLLAHSKQKGLPLAVTEMGVSSQASDGQRAQWLRAAFAFARSHGFVLVTYFNYTHRYWQIDPHTQAGAVLRTELNTD